LGYSAWRAGFSRVCAYFYAARYGADGASKVTILTVELPFRPRPWQRPLLDDASPRIVAVVHRRAGKSTLWVWRGLRKALTWDRSHLLGTPYPNVPGTLWTKARIAASLRENPVRVVHSLPFSVQWDRTGLWDRLERAASSIPGAKVQKDQRRVLLPNGGVYQAGGMDNPESWRGGYADEVILDEFDDTTGEGQVTAIEPMLGDFMGTLVRSGTPKGYGRLKAAYERAKAEEGSSAYLLRVADTGALSEAFLEQQRGEMSEEEFAQEYQCSFDAPNSGAYYAKLLQQAETDGRIGEVDYDPRLPVWTGWDLGMDDSTAVWFVQIDRNGAWRWIDYEEGSGEVLSHYAGAIRARPYAVYDGHILPHDAAVRDLGAATASTREATLNSLGVRPTRILARTGHPERINAMRLILPRSRFDARRCAVGLRALWHYRREWNDQAGVFRSNPVHDWASHAADAAGHLAQGAREPRAENARNLPRGAAAWDPYSTGTAA
jgi:hypothetical protein